MSARLPYRCLSFGMLLCFGFLKSIGPHYGDPESNDPLVSSGDSGSREQLLGSVGFSSKAGLGQQQHYCG